MEYRDGVKRGLDHVRRWNDDLRRARRARAGRAGGFSFIELLVVVAILLLLGTLYWGPLTSKSRQRQVQQDCQAHLQRIYTAFSIYAAEHDRKFPAVAGARTPAEALDPLVPRYMADTTVFTCPGVKDAPPPAEAPFRQHRVSYAYYMGCGPAEPQQALMSDEQVNARAKNAGELAFSSTGKLPGNNHGKFGGNFLFCDGSVTPTPPQVPFPLGLTPGVILLNPGPGSQ